MRKFLAITVLLSWLVGCSSFAGGLAPTPPPTPSPTSKAPVTAPAPTSAPTSTATAVMTPLPSAVAPTRAAPTQPVPTGGTPVKEPTLDKLIAQAKADLAPRAGVPESAITVKSTEAVEWGDASLGCPKIGVFYIQVITPGYKIVLEANGKAYNYHTGGSRVIYCEPRP